MLWVPQKGNLLVQHNVATVGSIVVGTNVPTSGTSNVKGTATQLISSLNFDAYWVTVHCTEYGASATASEGLVDILGGAATEEVIIPDLLMGYCATPSDGRDGKRWDFPLYIPAGTRIAARSSGARISTNMRVAIYCYGGDGLPPWRVGQKVTTYGVPSNVPGGTDIIPGASAVEGSWTTIADTTTEDHFALIPSFQIRAVTVAAARAYMVDIGVGGSGVTEEIAQSYVWTVGSNEMMSGPVNQMPCFQDIPAGTNLQMRASCNGAIDASYGAALHAMS